MFFGHFLLIKKVSSINHNIVFFYFYSWKKVSCVSCKTESLFTPWKLGSFKWACIVNLKLAFRDWFFLYNLIILIRLCKIWYLHLYKSLLFTRNQVICLKKLKTVTSSNYHKFTIFCWNLAHVSYLPMSTKWCSGFFWFCLDLELLIKM